MIYDEIIIGAGIAGLYWVYKSKPNNFLILEKIDRIGGRILNKEFYSTQISLGAGIIKENNFYTIKLAKDLGIELIDSISKYHMIDLHNTNEDYYYNTNNIIIKYLKNIYKKNKMEIISKKLNWNDFLNLYLDFNVSSVIKNCLLYKINNDSDIKSTLYDEIDELLRTKQFNIKYIKDKGYSIFLNKLIENIGIDNILLNSEVLEIKKENDLYTVRTNNQVFLTKKIILATESNINIKFLIKPQIQKKIVDLYNMVSGCNYLRVYTYHENGHGLDCSYKSFGIIGKVILINDKILMCSYTEDIDALNLFQLLEKNNSNKLNQIQIIYKLLLNCHINLTIPTDITYHFWNTGIHFNKNGYDINKKKILIKELFNENIVVIGESIADSHGWVNAALESVEYILNS